MSYKRQTDENILDDIVSRKEYLSLKVNLEDDFRNSKVFDPLDRKYLKLGPHQTFAANFINPNTLSERLHINHACHPIDTEILMYDGSVKKCQDIKVGHYLMGDDNKKRKVLKLHNGIDTIYTLTAETGEHFRCNEAHILCLFHRDKSIIKEYRLSEFLKFSETKQRKYSLYRVPINYKTKFNTVSPYTLGKRLYSLVNNVDIPINKLPGSYIVNSYDVRISFISGLLTANNYVKLDNYYMIRKTNNDNINKSLLTLFYSLGLRCYNCDRTILVSSKKIDNMLASETVETNWALLRFTVSQDGPGVYYGFSLDGNGRYLLDNYIVTHNTGTGKTLVALSIAKKYIALYNDIYNRKISSVRATRFNLNRVGTEVPSIHVLGFGGTKAAFIRDLFKYSEFGFITRSEQEYIYKLEKLQYSGDIKAVITLAEFKNSIKKRITNKQFGGFFKFYGYDEFVNRLFITDIKMTSLEQMVTDDKPLEDIITEMITAGKISVNTQFMDLFRNSLIIGDEIHNTYNSVSKNNRGAALKYLLDNAYNVKFVSLSATPINNSPSEVIELLSYLVPKNPPFRKKDFFDGTNKKLLPGKLEELGKLFRGFVSFFQDINPRFYPRSNLVGNVVTINEQINSFKPGDLVPYLKFIECPMSEYHQATLEHLTLQRENEEKEHNH